MTKEETKERIAVMQAYVDGKEIEFYNGTNGKWETLSDVLWCSNEKYRVKPTPKYRPFESAEECWEEMFKHEPFGWLKDINNGDYFPIKGVDDSEGLFERCFKRFTFVDGKPFGVIEEESK